MGTPVTQHRQTVTTRDKQTDVVLALASASPAVEHSPPSSALFQGHPWMDKLRPQEVQGCPRFQRPCVQPRPSYSDPLDLWPGVTALSVPQCPLIRPVMVPS